jgi:superfamily II DNA or RNA helicase
MIQEGLLPNVRHALAGYGIDLAVEVPRGKSTEWVRIQVKSDGLATLQPARLGGEHLQGLVNAIHVGSARRAPAALVGLWGATTNEVVVAGNALLPSERRIPIRGLLEAEEFAGLWTPAFWSAWQNHIPIRMSAAAPAPAQATLIASTARGLANVEVGVMAASVGAGKTMCAGHTARTLEARRVVFAAPHRDIVYGQQAVEMLVNWRDGEIVRLGVTETSPRILARLQDMAGPRVVVCPITPETLEEWWAADTPSVLSTTYSWLTFNQQKIQAALAQRPADLFIGDEGHHLGKHVLRKNRDQARWGPGVMSVPATHRLLLTGTPARLADGIVGTAAKAEVVAGLSYREARTEGLVRGYDIEVVSVDPDPTAAARVGSLIETAVSAPTTLQESAGQLVARSRAIIVERAIRESVGGPPRILVTVNRVTEAEELRAALLAADVRPVVHAYTGRMSPRERERAKDEVQLAPQGGVLIGVRAVSEGFNAPELNTLIILAPRHGHDDIVQLVGRTLRLSATERASGERRRARIIVPVVPEDVASAGQHQRLSTLRSVMLAMQDEDPGALEQLRAHVGRTARGEMTNLEWRTTDPDGPSFTWTGFNPTRDRMSLLNAFNFRKHLESPTHSIQTLIAYLHRTVQIKRGGETLSSQDRAVGQALRGFILTQLGPNGDPAVRLEALDADGPLYRACTAFAREGRYPLDSVVGEQDRRAKGDGYAGGSVALIVGGGPNGVACRTMWGSEVSSPRQKADRRRKTSSADAPLLLALGLAAHAPARPNPSNGLTDATTAWENLVRHLMDLLAWGQANGGTLASLSDWSAAFPTLQLPTDAPAAEPLFGLRLMSTTEALLTMLIEERWLPIAAARQSPRSTEAWVDNWVAANASSRHEATEERLRVEMIRRREEFPAGLRQRIDLLAPDQARQGQAPVRPRKVRT